MPSKYNEKMLRVDRMNKMEKSRLDLMIRRYDKEKISLVHEIDREKRAVVKDFAHVRRTSGFSEEGIPPSSEKDEEFKNDPMLKFGLRISEKRLNSAKSLRSSSAKSRTHFDFNGNYRSPRNPSRSSDSDDEVFVIEEINALPLPDFSNVADIERYEKELIENYKKVFRNTVISVKKSDKKNLNRFLRSRSEISNRKLTRPQTAKCKMSYVRQFSLPVRPLTANGNISNSKGTKQQECGNNFETRSYNSDKSSSKHSTSDNNLSSSSEHALKTVTEVSEHQEAINPSVKQLIEEILEEESENTNTHKTLKVEQNLPNGHNLNLKTENGILKTRKISTSTNQTLDVETDSRSRMLRQNSATGSRQRKVSINSVASGSVMSNMWGSLGDVSLDSNGQRKPSNWRKYVAADNAPIPETKRLVTLTTVVKAALAFSKTARKKALDKLVEEQSVDARQIIVQERLRRLQSRNNVLMSLSSQFSVEGNRPFTLMEEENF